MAEIKPFKALRPTSELVSTVNSSPYDVISRNEAAEVIKRNPNSFLKVIKPEATVPIDKNITYHELALKAARNLRELIDLKIMAVDSERCFYIYKQNNGSYQRTGIVANLSIDDYQKGLIKKHEKIRLDTWQERVEHIYTTRAHTGCPLIIFKSNSHIEELMFQEMIKKNILYDFVSEDGIRNSCWKINREDILFSLSSAFQHVRSLYIADGHHRVAAAAEVMKIKRQKQKKNKEQDNEYAYFPAVLIPHNQIRILGYHRVVKDLNKFSAECFLSKMRKIFKVEKLTPNQPFLPSEKHEIGMNLTGQWYRFFAKDNDIKVNECIINNLDVSLLQNQVLDPILGIKDSQKSNMVEFIGGKNALVQINKKIQQGAKLAFTLYPTSVDDLMAVSDNKGIMPPKSTWVEPKLRSGIFVHLF
jgi:uncharacterized protein (DUF1015 family)